MQLRKALFEHFGFAEFRGEQEQVIAHTLRGGNSLVIMPTGMGKSLCYQLPARLKEGVTLVISPLIALMKDQVDAARRRGFRAAAIHSALTGKQREQAYTKFAEGAYDLLYVTPERFRKPEFWAALGDQRVNLLAVDEAHCISQWGHDFRPDYRNLGEIRQRLGRPVTMALTATATLKVQQDILRQLKLDEDGCALFVHGIERPNLCLAVHSVVGLDEKVRCFVADRHRYHGPAIIYFSLVSTLEAFAQEVRRLGFAFSIYHGQMEGRARHRQQEAFFNGENELMLATPAFGLGIDKADIRWILHAEVPGSLEAYYQEIGRAGRDGEPAHAVLLYDQDDLTIQMDFIKWTTPDPEFIRGVYALVRDYPEQIRSEGVDFIRNRMNFYNRRDFRTETALNLLSRWGCLEGEWGRGKFQAVEGPPEEFLAVEEYQQRRQAQNEKLLEMLRFAQSSNCRLQTIYRYFGLTDAGVCGQCDNCLGAAPA